MAHGAAHKAADEERRIAGTILFDMRRIMPLSPRAKGEAEVTRAFNVTRVAELAEGFVHCTSLS